MPHLLSGAPQTGINIFPRPPPGRFPLKPKKRLPGPPTALPPGTSLGPTGEVIPVASPQLQNPSFLSGVRESGPISLPIGGPTTPLTGVGQPQQNLLAGNVIQLAPVNRQAVSPEDLEAFIQSNIAPEQQAAFRALSPIDQMQHFNRGTNFNAPSAAPPTLPPDRQGGPLGAPAPIGAPTTLPPGTSINPVTGEIIPVAQPAILPTPVGQPPRDQPVTIDGETGDVLPSAPPTGLIGAEMALGAAATGAIDALLTGLGISREDIQAGNQNAIATLEQARGSVDAATQQAIDQILTGAATGRGIISEGTAGSVSALEGGAAEARNLLSGAQTTVTAGTDVAAGSILSGGQAAQEFLSGAGGDVQTLLREGTGALAKGRGAGLDFLNNAFQQAVDPLTGFVDPGRRAQVLQAALTGVMGPEAQKAAILNFQDDPSLKFQVEEAERALLRNAARFGGLGGGNVRKELVRQAVGRAQQSFNTRISQLGEIASRGLSAATTIGSLRGQQGITGTNLIGRTAESTARLSEVGAGFASTLGQAGARVSQQVAQDVANLRQSGAFANADLSSMAATLEQATGQGISSLLQSGALTEADIEQSASNTISNLTSDAGFAQADISAKQAQIEQATGLNLADLANTTGINVAKLLTDLGSNSAELRSQAGRDIAAAIAQSSAQLAGLQEAQGVGISNIIGTDIANIASLLVQEGLVDAASQEQLAILLGNIATGQGTNAANIAANIGNIEAAGILGTSKQVQDGIKELVKILGEQDKKKEKEET